VEGKVLKERGGMEQKEENEEEVGDRRSDPPMFQTDRHSWVRYTNISFKHYLTITVHNF
jgi:hypothetical protein